ncbi:MAG: M43 family zinc metalloprotease [bacterium]|nr:M43 family zinc metalloprotease [bacterium]
MKLKPLLIALLFSFTALAQTPGIGTGPAHLILPRHCATVPPDSAWEIWFSQKIAEYKSQQNFPSSTTSNFMIPVIVHVIHGGEALATYPNVSAAQIYSQLKVLNEDYGGRGLNSATIASTGFSLVGVSNSNITFCLAQIDPLGNPLSEPGIDRVNYVSKGWANPAALGSMSGFQILMEGTIKPATIWNPQLFFNIWISDVNSSLFTLGYATFPSGSTLNGISTGLGGSTNDGIWIWSKSFGTVGTLHSVYNKGRSAVHETGHWLGLRHIGGDSGNALGDCAASDFCDDTPPQKGGANGGTNGQNFGAPVYPLHVNICASVYGDMFMNFMDYTDDAVMAMFTPDQSIRMQTAMTNGTFRSLLTASSATQCTVNYLGLPPSKPDEFSLRIIPNPSSGKIILELANPPQGGFKLILSNTMGQVLLNSELLPDTNKRFFLDLENYPEGIYSLTVFSTGNQTVRRLIISR